MSKQHQAATERLIAFQRQNRFELSIVAACFFLSGMAALIYQAAWLKQLAVVFGTSDTAVAVVLAAYMAGLAAGAAAAARLINRVQRPLLVYGILEALIGISALLVPAALLGASTLLAHIYGDQAQPVSAYDFGQTLYYLIATFLILAIPTSAMGATLPLLSRFVVHEEQHIGPRVGLLYGVNTLGAVVGALISGFIFLPYLGLFRTLAIGACLNLFIFVLVSVLSRKQKAEAGPAGRVIHRDASQDLSKGRTHWIMPIMLLSGMVSFTLEVFWTRLLTHVFGGTVYAFAVMLACFLTGIALGGLLAGRLAHSRRTAAVLFVVTQCSVAVLSYFSYVVINHWVPETSGLAGKSLYAFAVIFPATLFIGATYPLAVRVATEKPGQTASVAGRIYSWNTVGAIAGALMAGLYLLPLAGFGLTLKIAMLVSLALACISAMLLVPKMHRTAIAAAAVLCLVLLGLHPQRPDRLINAHWADQQDWGEEHYYGVGRSATILMRESDGFLTLSSNGLSESVIGRKGTPPANQSQKWLTGLPALARPQARSMLVIGFGGGVALEGIPPGLTEIDVVELEPEVIAAYQAVADLHGSNILLDPRVRLIINDARNALALTHKQYDIIVSQPSHPWTGGAAHLYTADFLAMARTHLKPNGVFLQWISSQFVDEPLLKSLMATLAHEFGHVELYQPERQELLFLASDSNINLWEPGGGAAQALLQARRHFNRMGLRSPEDALAMMSLDSAGVQAFAGDAPLNTDDHNRLAFFSRTQGDGLTADSMLELFGMNDPLVNPDSDFHRIQADQLALHQIAEQLLQANFIQRTSMLARAVSQPDAGAVIDALGFESSGQLEQSERVFQQVLAQYPDNKAAQIGLLRLHLGDLAERKISSEIAALANRQSGPDRRVLEGWVFGSAGEFEKLKALDQELAAVSPTSLLFPVSVKLRVDWRVMQSRQSGDPTIAREALDLLDDLLASYWNLDLYILRAGCAYLAGDSHAFVESAAAAARQVRQRLKRLKEGKEMLPAAEADYLVFRLRALGGQLSSAIAGPLGQRVIEVQRSLDSLLESVSAYQSTAP